MVSKNILISKLEPYIGRKDILINNQDTTDIINAILDNHEKYKSEYDKIYRYFVGETLDDTCYNVWAFLKDNFNYRIESEKMQILRSPAAILGSDMYGIDCKGYATFAAGVMSAIRRNVKMDFDVYYRFASYDSFDPTPQHVFAVVKQNDIEYWIDPVLDEYDLKKQPYFFKDKKIKDMALVALSGVNNNQVGSTLTDILDSVLKAAPSIITATQPVPNFGGGSAVTYQAPAPSTGISTNTLLLIAAAGIGFYFFTKKRR
jgi:hypothetical protein